MRYYLHSFGYVGVSLVSLAIGVGLFFLIFDGEIPDDFTQFILLVIIVLAPILLLGKLYNRVFHLSCPRCGNDLELTVDEDEMFGWCIYKCKFCGFSHNTWIPHIPTSYH